MSIAKYNFNNNLLKSSCSKNIDEVKKEWRIILKVKKNNHELCICQHKIKNITYLYNIYTRHTIIVGSKCLMKFNMNNISFLSNNIIQQIFCDNLIKGEYEYIDNIVNYSNNIEKQIINYFEKKANNNINNNNNLLLLKNEINELIINYNITYLNIVIIKINKMIMHIELINKINLIKYYNNEINVHKYNLIKLFQIQKEIKKFNFININKLIKICINKFDIHKELKNKILKYVVKYTIQNYIYSYFYKN
jgi:hypothetical protein